MAKLARWTLGLMLALSMVLPTVLQEAKIVLLGAVFVSLVATRGNGVGRARWWSPTVGLGIAYSTIGILWSLYGASQGNPGALRVLTVYVAYPLLFSILAAYYAPGDYRVMSRFMHAVTVLLVIEQGLFILSTYGLDGGRFAQLLGALHTGEVIGYVENDVVSYSLPSLASSFFLFPFLLASAMTARRSKHAYFLTGLAVVYLAVTIQSARRAIVPAFLTGLLVTVLFIAQHKVVSTRKSLARLLPLLIPVVVLIAIEIAQSGMQSELLSSRFDSMADFEHDSSNLERTLQFRALMGGFYDSPLFGKGAGAVAGYVRSATPWAYELLYVAILFQYGLLGFLSYVAGIVFLFVRIYRQALLVVDFEKARFLVGVLAGFASFIVASATNPYLLKFDYMWVVFLPVSIVNCLMTTGDV